MTRGDNLMYNRQRSREGRSKSPQEGRHRGDAAGRHTQKDYDRHPGEREGRSTRGSASRDGDDRRDYYGRERAREHYGREDRHHEGRRDTRDEEYHRGTEEERGRHGSREYARNEARRDYEQRDYRAHRVDAQPRRGEEQKATLQAQPGYQTINFLDRRGEQHRERGGMAVAPLETRTELPLHPILAEVVNPPPSSHPRHQKKGAEPSLPLVEDGKLNPYFDTSLIEQGKPRDRKTALNFHQRGKFVSKVTQAREQATLEALIKDIAKTAEKAGLDLDPLLRPGAGSVPVEESVSVEWWDAPFVPSGYDGPIDYSVIDHMIQQPSFFEPLDLKVIDPKPVHLTEAERKKARRMRRLAEQADHQDMIRAGLIPPDPSRTKAVLPTRSTRCQRG